jgi:hypothetical protein
MRRIVYKWGRYEWAGEPKRWSDKVLIETRTQLWDVRERPIPPIHGETEREYRMRRMLNAEWCNHEDSCLRRGERIPLPAWDGPAAPTRYTEPRPGAVWKPGA